MNLKNRNGFTLMEAMLGFVLFSMMLMVYLPSYHQELQRLQQLKNENMQWQLFYDLAKSSIRDSEADDFLAKRLQAYQLLHNEQADFHCETTHCRIDFKNGDYYEIVLQEIQ